MVPAVRSLLVAAFVVSLFGNSVAAQDTPSVSNSPEISIEGVGTLRTETGSDGDGFLAVFEGVNPLSRSCSGRCGDRWQGSWTCPDDKSCYLNCGSDSPGQCN